MDAFVDRFLKCSKTVVLIPGPLEFSEPCYSLSLDDIQLYPAQDVISSLNRLEHTSLIQPGGFSSLDEWFAWRWRWEHEDRWIEIGFSVLEANVFEQIEPVYWGGSMLTTSCTYSDVVWMWRALQQQYPGMWVQDSDCRLLTPHRFLKTYALPLLQEALYDQDQAIRKRAERELETYRLLGYQPAEIES
jgi:hypothetical protein